MRLTANEVDQKWSRRFKSSRLRQIEFGARRNTQMLRIGSDVSQLIQTPYAAGVQRVVVETHKGINELAKANGDELYGVNLSKHPINTNHKYIQSDPLLKKLRSTLQELDILLLLDGNIKYVKDEIAKTGFGGTVVSLLHDLLPVSNPEYFNFEHNPNYLQSFRFYLINLLRISDIIVTTSESTVKTLGQLKWKHKASKLHVLHLGTFNTSLKPAPSNLFDFDNRLVCVNTIEPRKGHDDILAAFDILNKNKPLYELVLIGKQGWDVDELSNRIKNHKLFGSKLFWYENISDAKMNEILQRSQIAINASRAEGFGLTIEEALSLGKKVIARDIPVFRERATKNLFFFEGNGETLAQKIKEVEKQPLEEIPKIRTMQDFANDIYSIITEIGR